MKLPFLAIFTTIMFFSGIAIGQPTYTWNVAGGGDWTVPANWTPARAIPAAADILVFNNGGTYIVNNIPDEAIGKLQIANNTNVTFQPDAIGGSSTIIAGTAAVDAIIVAAGSTLRLQGKTLAGINRNMDLTTASVAGLEANISGTLISDDEDLPFPDINSSGNFTKGALATINFLATGTYEHSINGGNIPASNWLAGSTCKITGVTLARPGQLTQNYSNWTWDCINQAVNINLDELLTTVNGNLTVANAGGGTSFAFADANVGYVLNVGGNFIKSGGKLIAVEAANQTITINIAGDFIMTADDFIMTQDINSTVNINVGGNWSQTGGFLTENSGGSSSGQIFFTKAGIQTFTSGGFVFNNINFTVNFGSTLQMATPTTIVTGASFTLTARATLGITSPDGIATVPAGLFGNIQTNVRNFDDYANYLYNGTGNQITGTAYPSFLTGDLIIDNPGNTVTLDNPRIISSGGRVNLRAGIFATGTNLELFTGSAIIRSSGTMTGTFTGGDYDVVYNGTSKTSGPELQGGQGGETRLSSLGINLSTGQTVTLAALTEMKGQLFLLNGFLSTGATRLDFTETATCPFGGSPSSFIIGQMRKTGVDDFVFPIGAGSSYRPIGYSGSATDFTTDLSATATIEAQAFIQNPKAAITPYVLTGSLLSLTGCYFWQLTRVDAGTNDVHVWASTGPVDAVFRKDFLIGCFNPVLPNPADVLPADLRVARHNGASWQDLGQGAQATSNNAWFISASIASTSFSPFTIGSSQNVLPVTLTDFTARKDGEAVNLNWATKSEQNNAYFNIERSADGVSFSSIGKVNGAGNSSLTLNYNYTDKSPLAGKNFYRLRQVDLDARFVLSSIVSVNMQTSSGLNLYPMPVQSQAFVQYPKAARNANYRIVSIDGRIVKSGKLQENSTQMSLNLGELKSGNYILIINDNGKQYQQRIQKQ